MVTQVEINLPPFSKGFHLITDIIVKQLPQLPAMGILHLFIKHTSAGLTINENADPSVRTDINEFFNRLVPEDLAYFTHTIEGPDDMPAHIKVSILGYSVSIPISEGRLNLGTWQGIYLCEFRNRGSARRMVATIIS
jgi:secondary thiamine-phosphate synthase enzyme